MTESNTEAQAPKEKEFSMVQKILNRVVDLVPEARTHMGNNFKMLHDEIEKLIPKGNGIPQGTIDHIADLEKQVQDLIDLPKKVEELEAKALELETALSEKDQELKNSASNLDQAKNDLNEALAENKEASDKINDLTEKLAASTAQPKPETEAPAGAPAEKIQGGQPT